MTTHEPRGATAPPRTPTEIPIAEGFSLPLSVVQTLIQAEITPQKFFGGSFQSTAFTAWMDARRLARQLWDAKFPRTAEERQAWAQEREGVA